MDNKPYKELDPITTLEKSNRTIGLPSISPELALKFLKNINEAPKSTVETYYKDADEVTLVAFNKLSDGVNNTFTYGGTVKDNYFPKDVKYGDKSLLATNRSAKASAKGKRAKEARVAVKLGVSLPSIVYLYHSGFWIKLDRISSVDKIRLSAILTELVKNTAINTGTLMYDIKGYKAYEAIITFIKNKIQSTSLKVPKGKDIFDFVDVRDLNIIVAVLLRQYYAKGFSLALNCKNAVNDKDIDIKCTHVTEIDVDFYKLIVPFDELIPVEAKKILAAQDSYSITVDDIEEYRNLLKISHETTIDISDYVLDVDELLLTTYFPKINDYIERCKDTYMDISEALVSQIMDINESADDDYISEVIQTELEKRKILSIGHYFKSLKVDGEEIDNHQIIVEYLLDLEDLTVTSEENSLFAYIRDKHYDFLKENKVAIVGINDYVCPNCKETQAEEGSDLIEIDSYYVFYLAKSILG